MITDALVMLAGLLLALVALRVAPPLLTLILREGTPLAHAVTLYGCLLKARWTWRDFARDTRLAYVAKEGRITTRQALWALMPDVRVERRAPDRYRYPRLRIRVHRYGLSGHVTTTPAFDQEDLADLSRKVCDQWGLHRIAFYGDKPGRVTFTGFRYEPLNATFRSDLLSGGMLAASPKTLTAADPLRIAVDQDGQAINVNLATTAHGLIAGGTRSGKSTTVNNFLAGAAVRAHVRTVIIDPGLSAAAPWWRTAHRVTDAQHPDEPTEILREVREEMTARQSHFWSARTDKIDQFSEDMPLYLVVIDELTNYTKHSDKKAAERFTAELLAIASQGAKFGIRLWLIAQKPGADVLPTAVRTNLSTRICHRVDTTEDFVHLFPDGRDLGITAADRTMPAGVAITHVPGMPAPVRAKAVHLSTDECWQISDALTDAGHAVRELPTLVDTDAA